MTEEEKMDMDLAKAGVLNYVVSVTVGGRTQELRTDSRENAIELAHFIANHFDEQQNKRQYLNVYRLFSKQTSGRQFVLGIDIEKERVAHPKSRFFFKVFQRDCEGIAWTSFYEFQDLREACEALEENYRGAEGTWNCCSISREDFEELKVYRSDDVFAEMMGY